MIIEETYEKHSVVWKLLVLAVPVDFHLLAPDHGTRDFGLSGVLYETDTL